MNEPAYHVQECNALCRAIPKLLRALHGKRADSPAWDEAYHVYYAVAEKHGAVRRRINEEVAPWFDGSAFKEERNYEHEVDFRTDWTGDPNVINGTQSWVVYYCKVCGAEGDELDERPCDGTSRGDIGGER